MLSILTAQLYLEDSHHPIIRHTIVPVLPVVVMKATAQDGNAGLLKQALAARQMRHTQRLTQTYLTLSLADIAQHVGLPSRQEAEQHILRQAASLLAMLDCKPTQTV